MTRAPAMDAKYHADDYGPLLYTVDHYDPTEPLIQRVLTGYLRSIPASHPRPVPDEHGTRIADWCTRAAQYAALAPATLTGPDIWALHTAATAHPHWFTPDQRAWIDARLPWAIVDTAIS